MTLLVEELLVKSRERVRAYGEVFTPRHMVDRMLDIVADDLELGPDFIDKTFLEPAAGDGNFLVAILERKLKAVQARIQPELWPQESLFALASIYGIELLEDNHADAKAAMLKVFVDFHRSNGTGCGPRTDLHRAAAFLIKTNILRGNTLTGLDHRGEDLEFSWWHRDPDVAGTVLREPFRFASLREDSLFNVLEPRGFVPCAVDQVHHEKRHDG
ncbi:hypothetical protein BW730_14330 [Tessaracoccus aquimaris]|uniref:Methylase n=1 Tax=Tessaracoccus aquimaris TaxID=1332264 RepID=A0A1Q2CQW0_9ACTN|nr:hypothetical protein [Tessaracoccus aquimaris]AQP48509.1 hypothetical protein BW730_14330 [Tessaracoccus aquimaris]